MVWNEEGKVVRNVHVCVSHGSSAGAITVRRAAHVFVVKPESSEVDVPEYFQSFSEQVGQQRRLLIHPGIHGAEEACKPRQNERLFRRGVLRSLPAS